MELLVLLGCLVTIAVIGWRRPALLRRAGLLTVVGLAAAIAAGVVFGLLLRH